MSQPAVQSEISVLFQGAGPAGPSDIAVPEKVIAQSNFKAKDAAVVSQQSDIEEDGAAVVIPAPDSQFDDSPGATRVENIEVDDLENDSAFADDNGSLASSRTSLLSAIARYRTDNGRTYHAYKEGSI
jgi:hypothetical protein